VLDEDVERAVIVEPQLVPVPDREAVQRVGIWKPSASYSVNDQKPSTEGIPSGSKCQT
jgi:hypothetical protein